MLFVLDAMVGQDALATAQAFLDGVGFDGVVLTKLDGDARGGAALSVRGVTGKPIMFASNGEKLDDFDVFHPERMASRILDMGDMLTLIEQAEKVFERDQAEEMAAKLAVRHRVHPRRLPRPAAGGPEDGVDRQAPRHAARHERAQRGDQQPRRQRVRPDPGHHPVDDARRAGRREGAERLAAAADRRRDRARRSATSTSWSTASGEARKMMSQMAKGGGIPGMPAMPGMPGGGSGGGVRRRARRCHEQEGQEGQRSSGQPGQARPAGRRQEAGVADGTSPGRPDRAARRVHRPAGPLRRFGPSGCPLWQTDRLYPTGWRPSHRSVADESLCADDRQPHVVRSCTSHQNQELPPPWLSRSSSSASARCVNRTTASSSPTPAPRAADGRSRRSASTTRSRTPRVIQVDSDRVQYWLGVGAQPTEAVAAILRVTGDWQSFKGEPAPPPMLVAEPKADKKSVFEAAAKESAGIDEKSATTPKAKKKAAPKADDKAEAKASADKAEAKADADAATESADTPAADAQRCRPECRHS